MHDITPRPARERGEAAVPGRLHWLQVALFLGAITNNITLRP